MKQNWNYFYNKIKSELLNLEGDSNEIYLSVLQNNTVSIEEWIEKTNIKQYKETFYKYSLYKYNKMDISLYYFIFDWCSIQDEVHYFLRTTPFSFENFISIIHYIFDFLLSYNSLIECPDYPNSELYYREFENNIIYENKFPPILYDLEFNIIKTDVIPNYCKAELLKLNNLYRY